MEEWIQTARADPVAVVGEFLDHAEPEDGLYGGVMQDVQTNQPGVEVAVGRQALGI
jgi:hypothetical protein